MPDKNLKVCYFGTYRAEYSRNQIMIEALRCNGVEVIECHEQLWHSIDDRVETVKGGWLRLRFWKRVIRAYIKLLQKYRKVGSYDVLIVGYPGQFDVAIARLLSWVSRKPLVWDIFMSIYLIAQERGLGTKYPFIIKLLQFWERIACHIPDILLIDTSEYINWFHYTYGITTSRFHLIPTGADDRIFRPLPDIHPDNSKFLVVYYGTFIPNHGVQYIIEAARKIRDKQRIKIIFIGDGPDRDKVINYAEEHDLKNVQFINWLKQETLVERVNQADICLGAFGTTPQSLMTVQNKIYECLAMKKPVLTGDSQAIREVFTHGEHIYVCKRADPDSIALAITTLYNNPSLRNRIAHEGYYEFMNKYSLSILGSLYKQHLMSIMNQS